MDSKKSKNSSQMNKTTNLNPQGLIGLDQPDDEILELFMDQIW